MNCLKCGRETSGEQVFCEDCLLDMEKYPVKPGTVVILPKRRENTAPKKVTKRRIFPVEDQVKILKRHMVLLTALLVVCLVLIAVMVYPSVQYLMEDHFRPGQNYTSVTNTDINNIGTTAN